MSASKVVVFGEMSGAGIHELTEEDNTILDVLGRAGAAGPDANLKEIRVVRGDPMKPEIVKVNVRAILNGDLSQNLELRNGDIVYVPKSYILQIEEVLRVAELPLRVIDDLFRIRALFIPNQRRALYGYGRYDDDD